LCFVVGVITFFVRHFTDLHHHAHMGHQELRVAPLLTSCSAELGRNPTWISSLGRTCRPRA
jgi:hypothetical protein